MGSSDVKLQYVDDSIDSYSNIWNNAKTDITSADQTRLIESLKKLSEADIAVFVGDYNTARGCIIEYTVCREYGVPIYEYNLEYDLVIQNVH